MPSLLAQGETNQLPVSGTLRGHYDVHSGLLAVSQLNLATPHTEANASGELGSRDVQLKVAITTSSLQEFQPLLTAMGQSSLPVELNGRASFNGTVGGKLAHPDIAGRLLATDFSYIYTPAPPPAHRHRRRMPARWHRCCTSDKLRLSRPQPAPRRSASTSIRSPAMCSMAGLRWRCTME